MEDTAHLTATSTVLSFPDRKSEPDPNIIQTGKGIVFIAVPDIHLINHKQDVDTVFVG